MKMNSIVLLCILSFASDTKITESNVRLRIHPDGSSRILKVLSYDESVEIVSESDKYVTVGKYYGKWVKVRLSSAVEGYVLSCFLSTWRGEKVHQFIDGLMSKKYSFFKTRVIFPVIFDENGIEKKIDGLKDFPKYILSENLWEIYDEVAVYTNQDIIVCHFSIKNTGSSLQLYIVQRNDKYYVNKIIYSEY